MKCEYNQVHPGVWVCPVCDHKALTSHAPARNCPQAKPDLVAVAPVQPTSPVVRRDQYATERDYQAKAGRCIHRGNVTQTLLPCVQCGQKDQVYDVYSCDKHGQCTLGNRRKAGDPPMQACIGCAQWTPPFSIVPAQGGDWAYRGCSKPHPSTYNVTAIIPVVEPDKCLLQVLRLLQLQTERPYIQLIDTGSRPETLAWLETLRDVDIEVQHLRTHGFNHASELVSMALDTAIAINRTPFTFFTHADCFLRSPTVISELMALAAEHVVAGHQITERPYVGWETEFGHTLLMCDQDRLNQLGIKWSMRAGMQALGIDDYSDPRLPPNFVDTERGFNAALRSAGIPGFFTGTEKNFVVNRDKYMRHVRSLCGSKLYSEEYQAKALTWLPEAVQEAEANIELWSQNAHHTSSV
jgi:hypothetical protein